MVVENRAGAGGTVGADAVAKSAPDGYTLLLGSNGPLTNAPVLQARLAYDPARDFAAIAMISRSPVTLSVRADSPWRSVADVLAAARARPGDISIGSSGQGSATHFLIEQMMVAAGVRLTHVPYRGSSMSVPDVVAGNIPVVMAEVSSVLPMFRGGQVRILAMSSAGRMPIAPDVPTLIEGGLNLTGGSWAGLVAAAGTPAPVVATLAAAVRRGLADPAYRARQAELGAEIVAEADQAPEGFAAWLDARTRRHPRHRRTRRHPARIARGACPRRRFPPYRAGRTGCAQGVRCARQIRTRCTLPTPGRVRSPATGDAPRRPNRTTLEGGSPHGDA